MATVTPPRSNRDKPAFSDSNDVQAGEIPKATCAAAGLHDQNVWAKVKNVQVGDLMTLSGFHEGSGGPRHLPQLKDNEKAAIVKAMELHTGMNYYGNYPHGDPAAFHACCTCI